MRKSLRWLGLVSAVLIPSVVLAIVVQHRSRLPGRYSWRFSPELLWDNVRDPWFPVFAVMAMAFGFSRRGHLLAPFRDATPRRRGIALGVALASTLVAGFGVATYEPIDVACVGLVAGYLALLPSPTAKGLAIAGAEAAFSMAAYIFASYAHTVGKALMLVRPARDEVVIGLERALFGVPIHALLTQWTEHSPTLLAIASRLYRTQIHQMLLYTLVLTCAAEKRVRREFLATIAISLVVAAPLYHVVPCVGPFYVDPDQYRHLMDVNLVSDWYRWLARNTGETLAGRSYQLITYQYIAAMPSLHVGFTAAMVYAGWRWPVLRAFSIVLALATWITTMILGWHYFLDGLFGLILCGLVLWMVRRLSGALLPSPFYPEWPSPPWPPARTADVTPQSQTNLTST